MENRESSLSLKKLSCPVGVLFILETQLQFQKWKCECKWDRDILHLSS